MNDRCVSLLENYELEVLRTRKGRSAVLCETNNGVMIFKEYTGSADKCRFQDAVLSRIRQSGFPYAEEILRNKEDALLTEDTDGTLYILKTYFEGRECNIRDSGERERAMQTLARLHKASEPEAESGTAYASVSGEFEKHNRELKKIRKYLKEKSQKTDFELFLMRIFDEFQKQAFAVTESYKEQEAQESSCQSRVVCHGDFQHHNLLIRQNTMYVVNFEKCQPGRASRDIYLFLRKLLEKSDWEISLGRELLKAYNAERMLEAEDLAELYFRLAYPEKFWKIANYYYNSGKAFIPAKNLEKLVRVSEQQRKKQEFLRDFQREYGVL